MKVIVEERGNSLEYPYLMKSAFSDLIVLFYGDQEGVVIYGGVGTFPVGYHSDGWDMDTFEPFKDRVVLEN